MNITKRTIEGSHKVNMAEKLDMKENEFESIYFSETINQKLKSSMLKFIKKHNNECHDKDVEFCKQQYELDRKINKWLKSNIRKIDNFIKSPNITEDE